MRRSVRPISFLLVVRRAGTAALRQPAGDRKGTWSLMVTRNWRIMFRIDPAEEEIFDLDYEDYH